MYSCLVIVYIECCSWLINDEWILPTTCHWWYLELYNLWLCVCHFYQCASAWSKKSSSPRVERLKYNRKRYMYVMVLQCSFSCRRLVSSDDQLLVATPSALCLVNVSTWEMIHCISFEGENKHLTCLAGQTHMNPVEMSTTQENFEEKKCVYPLNLRINVRPVLAVCGVHFAVAPRSVYIIWHNLLATTNGFPWRKAPKTPYTEWFSLSLYFYEGG